MTRERNTAAEGGVGFGGGEMKEMSHPMFHRWLAAERGGRDADAEAALVEMFGLLPAAAPSPGFAGRVLAAAGFAKPAPALAWGLRLLTTAGLLATGLLAAILVPWLAASLRLPSAGSAVEALAGAIISLVDKLVAALTVGRFLSGLGEALWAVAVSPTSLAVLLLVSAVTALLLRWLEALLAWERKGYVEAH